MEKVLNVNKEVKKWKFKKTKAEEETISDYKIIGKYEKK